MRTTKMDMHVHSIHSMDGNETPEDIIKAAGDRNLEYISITDHDSIDAFEQIVEEKGLPKDTIFVPYDNGVKLVSGSEVTCFMDVGLGKKVKFHVLVYGYDLSNKEFVDFIRRKNFDDRSVDWGIFEYLHNANPRLFTISRKEIQHLTEELKRKNRGFNRFRSEDVIRYFAMKNKVHESVIAKYANEYIQRQRLDIDIVELINLAHKAGGVCLLAHPRNSMSKFLQKNREHRLISSINSESFYLNVIQRLLDIGLDGVDVSKNKNKVDSQIIDMVCGKYMTTVGSDFHGFHSHMLGKRCVFHDKQTGQDFFEELDDRRANIIDILKVIERYRAEGKIAPAQRAAQDRIVTQETKLFTIKDGELQQNELDGKSYHIRINGDVKVEDRGETHTSKKPHEMEDGGRSL